MPGSLDEAGNNSFFTGYHEAPALPVTRLPSVSTRNPMDSVKYLVIKRYPTMTSHEMDRVWALAREPGLNGVCVLETYRDEQKFRAAVEGLADRVSATSRVVKAYITHINKG